MSQDRDEASIEYDKSLKLTYEDLFVKHAAVENEAQTYIEQFKELTQKKELSA